MSFLEKLVLEYEYEDWNYTDLIQNENISMEFILQHSSKFNLDEIIYSPHYNLENIQKYNIQNINYYQLCRNIDLTDENLELIGDNINWNGISLNKNLNEEFVEKYKEYINFDRICINKNISFQYLLKNLDKIKLIYNLSNNPNITIEDYENYKNKIIFNEYYLCKNKNFTIDYLIKNGFSGNNGFSENINICFEDLLKYRELFSIYSILRNQSFDTIDIKYLLNNIDDKKIIDYMSGNPNLNSWFIKKYKHYINFHFLSHNKFKIDNLSYYKKRKEGSFEKNKIIEEELIMKTWHPKRFQNWCLSIDEIL